LQRRRLFPLLAAATAVAWSPRWATAATPAAAPAPPPGTPFDATTVIDLARALAAKPFEPPDTTLPDELKNLKYDQYRSIRFDTTKALWGGQGTEFQAQFFHRGFLYTSRVDIAQVIGGRAMPIEYVPDLFHFDHVPKPKIDNLGFAGFRIHAPINRPDYFDEVCAFLGASYFRAVGRDQVYGLSARGLAIKTADPTGEEFPVFKSFWLERPPILSGARARQPEHIGRLPIHHPSRLRHYLRRRGDLVPAHRYRRSRHRPADQHVLLRRRQQKRDRRLPPRRPRFRRAADAHRQRRTALAPVGQSGHAAVQRLRGYRADWLRPAAA
jgi:hypothetical protein